MDWLWLKKDVCFFPQYNQLTPSWQPLILCRVYECQCLSEHNFCKVEAMSGFYATFGDHKFHFYAIIINHFSSKPFQWVWKELPDNIGNCTTRRSNAINLKISSKLLFLMSKLFSHRIFMKEVSGLKFDNNVSWRDLPILYGAHCRLKVKMAILKT